MDYLYHAGCEHCQAVAERISAIGYVMPSEVCKAHGWPKEVMTVPLTHPDPSTNLQEMTVEDGLDFTIKENKLKFVTKDSGERQEFDSGMIRDVTTGKTEWHRITEGPMIKRWAELLTRGGVKYPDVQPGKANWTLAEGEAEYQRFRQSAFRHFMIWFTGEDTSEDHAAAIYFNVNGAEYVKGKLK